METMSFPKDLRSLLEPHKGQWVALSSDEKNVLGYGNTLDEALKMAKSKEPEDRPVLIKVPIEGAGCILI